MSSKSASGQKMPRKTVALIVVIILVLIALGVGVGYWAVKHGPMAHKPETQPEAELAEQEEAPADDQITPSVKLPADYPDFMPQAYPEAKLTQADARQASSADGAKTSHLYTARYSVVDSLEAVYQHYSQAIADIEGLSIVTQNLQKNTATITAEGRLEDDGVRITFYGELDGAGKGSKFTLKTTIGLAGF